jgi:signal transduction histidine kinase
VLIYNMTQIKRLESNVQRADRLTSIGTMAAGMAHEVKNPLQSIKTFTQLLPQRFEDADFRKTFCEVVLPEVQRIDTIVTRLLDFARTRPVRFQPCDVRRVVEEVLALAENQIRKAKLEVTTEFPATILKINADEQRLHQVFLNLILNAIHAMKETASRRLSIAMSYGRVHLAGKGQPAFFDVPCVRVEVSDTGCGIPEEHLEQLFTPFFTTKDDGSGLGLSVVHGIVTEHGGEIDVTSTVAVGTTFALTFPLMAEAEMLERVGT